MDLMSGPKDQQRKTDVFISVYGVMHVIVNSRKSKGIELREWIMRDVVPRGFNKLIEEKDTQLALLNDNLARSHRQLEYTNTGFQGEIRAKDQEIARRERENAMLRERYVDHCQDPGKDNVVMIARKHTCKDDDKHFEYPYYISRIQRLSLIHI